MSQTQIQLTSATSTLLEEGIILYEIHANADITIEDLNEGRKANAELSGGHDYCVLVKGGMFSSINKDAREAQTTEQYTKNRIAMAVLANNPAIEIMAKLFLSVNKPIGVTKIFSDEAKALKWLKEKRDEHIKQKK